LWTRKERHRRASQPDGVLRAFGDAAETNRVAERTDDLLFASLDQFDLPSAKSVEIHFQVY
jgi:hypothetical protein